MTVQQYICTKRTAVYLYSQYSTIFVPTVHSIFVLTVQQYFCTDIIAVNLILTVH